MLKKKLVAVIVMLAVFSGWFTPAAKAETSFQADQFPNKVMQIQVMPEFDYPEDWETRDVPSLLVGMYGTITNKSGQDYDGKIEIPVPANDNGFEGFLVAEFPEENKPEVQRPYDVDKEKGIISWKPANAIKNNQDYKFVIEYYTKTIDVKDKKSFTYEYKNNADTAQLDVIFYAPMNAKEIQLEPRAQENSKNEYGEEIYFYQYTNVKKGESLKYSFSYKKDGTESTMEAISKVQTSNDTNQSGGSGTATDQIINGGSENAKSDRPIIGTGGASIIGIAIIIAGIFIFLGLKASKQTRAGAGKQNKNQPNKPASAKKENKAVSDDAKKELRKRLLTGKIDQETYDEEMKKLI